MNSENNKNYKRLPCVVYLMTGSCPFRERCQFKHPEGLKGPTCSKTRKKNIENQIKDLFYYPQIEIGNIEEYDIKPEIRLGRLQIFQHLEKGKSIETYRVHESKYIKMGEGFKLNERDARTSHMFNNLITFIKDNRNCETYNNFNKKNVEFYCGYCTYQNDKRQDTNSPKCVKDIY